MPHANVPGWLCNCTLLKNANFHYCSKIPLWLSKCSAPTSPMAVRALCANIPRWLPKYFAGMSPSLSLFASRWLSKDSALLSPVAAQALANNKLAGCPSAPRWYPPASVRALHTNTCTRACTHKPHFLLYTERPIYCVSYRHGAITVTCALISHFLASCQDSKAHLPAKELRVKNYTVKGHF